MRKQSREIRDSDIAISVHVRLFSGSAELGQKNAEVARAHRAVLVEVRVASIPDSVAIAVDLARRLRRSIRHVDAVVEDVIDRIPVAVLDALSGS